MEKEDKVREIIKLLRILSYGLIGGVVFLMVVAVLMVQLSGQPIASADETFSYYMLIILLILTVGGLVGGYIMFKKRMAQISPDDPVFILDAYKGAMITRLALIEGAAFFGIVTYLLLGNTTALIISCFLLVYMIVLHPTAKRILNETGIDPSRYK